MSHLYKKNGCILTRNGGALDIKSDYSFPVVRIGSQVWTTTNLDVDDGGTGIRTINTTFGVQKFYTCKAAERIAATIDGWHLPTLAEWNVLKSFVGGDAAKLKSVNGWYANGGTNETRFNGLPVGYCMAPAPSHYVSETKQVMYWTDTPFNSQGYYYNMLLDFHNQNVIESYSLYTPTEDGGDWLSVRLVKD
jgi:uncharacterized protein (TIGR02145 family)